MKKKLRKLTLARETLHTLDGDNLRNAVGGLYTVNQAGCSVNYCFSVDSCPTLSCNRSCPTACNPTACE